MGDLVRVYRISLQDLFSFDTELDQSKTNKSYTLIRSLKMMAKGPMANYIPCNRS